MQYKLPDGTTTEDAEIFKKALYEFAKPLEDLMGYSVAGYDPGIMFRTDNGKNRLTLPIDFVTKINKVLKELKSTKELMRDALGTIDSF